jgi:hypothetical protein
MMTQESFFYLVYAWKDGDLTGDELYKRVFVLPNVSHCGLTEVEYTERERLLELQRNHQRWLTKEEFDRLKELSNKMFKNAGSPHCG